MRMSQQDVCHVISISILFPHAFASYVRYLSSIQSLISVGCWKIDIITMHLIQDVLVFSTPPAESITFAENVMKTIWFSKRYCLSHVLHICYLLHITAKLKREQSGVQID